jgi:hypothetical protein
MSLLRSMQKQGDLPHWVVCNQPSGLATPPTPGTEMTHEV